MASHHHADPRRRHRPGSHAKRSSGSSRRRALQIEWERHDAGVIAFKRYGQSLPPALLDSIKRNKVALKGPVTTPIGEGFTSVNVGLRKALDLYANLRPVKNLPGVASRFQDVDLIIVRENTEDLYAGLEHEIVPGVVESLKIITEKASTRIAQFAFEYARTARAQARHRDPQGQHHEAQRRPVPRQLRGRCRASSPTSPTTNGSSTPRACTW